MPIACVHCAKAKAKCDKKVSRAPKTTYHRKRADVEVNGTTVEPAVAYLWQGSSVFDLLLQASVGNKS